MGKSFEATPELKLRALASAQYENMATLGKSCRNFRAWKPIDSAEPNDVCRLYDPEKVPRTKPVKCVNYWTACLLLFGVITLFLFGVLVGFYVRESQKAGSCEERQREDGFDSDRLQAVHNNIMYFMSGEKAMRYYRDLSASQLPLSDVNWDKKAADLVETELRAFGLDHVEIEDQDVVVTYPDPLHPNRLEVVEGGRTTLNLTIQGNHTDDKVAAKGNLNDDEPHKELPPFVAFSPPGEVEGPLVYVHYGRYLDFLHLTTFNMTLRGSVVLLRMGKISVAEKVKWAEKFGAAGVLLYCDLDLCSPNERNGVFASAADFSGQDDGVYPTIPVQTVSMATATKLLRNYPGVGMPNVWKSSLQSSMKIHLQKTGELIQVKLSVYNKKATKRIRNIVGTIYGSMETDRYVMVGAGRSWFPDGSRDAGSNTALLLELAHSLSYIRKANGWKPRRGIVFCSWGGTELANSGLMYYIKRHQHMIRSNVVTYLEFDLRQTGSDLMQFSSSPSLIGMIRNAAGRVPDVADPDLSVVDTWPQPTGNWFLSQTFPLKGYHRNTQQYPMIHQLGVPTVSVNYLGVPGGASQVSTNFDVQHHFAYHISTARVVSLVLIGMVDNEMLPFRVDFYSHVIAELITESVQIMNQLVTMATNSTEELLTAVQTMEETSTKFDNSVKDAKQSHDAVTARTLNDIMMKFDGLFVDTLPHHSSSQYLLCQDEENGSLVSFTEAIDDYIISRNGDSIHSLIASLTAALQQASSTMSANQR